MMLALLATACGGDSSTIPAEHMPSPGADKLPVIGQEQPVLLIEPDLVSGVGLGQQDTYPLRLETALLASGLNIRLITVRDNLDPAAVKTRIAQLQEKPVLALVSGKADVALFPIFTAAGIPVHRLDLETPLKQKPDLFVRGTKNLNVQGVEELVAATAAGVAEAMPRK